MSNRGTIRRGFPDRARVDAFEKRECRVFDVEKKALIATYSSLVAAGRALGITPWHITEIIRHKRRHKNKKLGLTITIR